MCIRDRGQTVAEGGSLGNAPLNEAKTYYQNDPQTYKTVAGLTRAGAGDHGIGWMIPHLLGTGLSFAGEQIGGIPLAMAGELLGYIGGRKLTKAYSARRGMGAIQQAYPQATGAQPTGGTQPVPQTVGGFNTGDQIKNLMMGMTQ